MFDLLRTIPGSEFACPSCGKGCAVATVEDGAALGARDIGSPARWLGRPRAEGGSFAVLHELPHCALFGKLSADRFLGFASISPRREPESHGERRGR